MNSQTVDKLVHLLANIGVIAGMFFLVFELHQNNEQLEAQARFNHKEGRVGASVLQIENESLMQTLLKARKDEPLTDLESAYLDRFRDVIFSDWQWEYDESVRTGLERPIVGYKALLRREHYLIGAWQNTRLFYTEDFRTFMDDLVREL